MEKIYDVIICGAGPGGSIAAICLQRKGLSVLLIDSKDFPRDKVCGDQITPLGVQLLKELKLVDSELLKSTNEIDKVLIKGPEKAQANFQFDFLKNQSKIYIIPRLILDNHLVKNAEKSGVERHTSHIYEMEYSEDHVSIKSRTGNSTFEFKSKIVIGADGSSSTIARLSKLVPGKDRGIAIRGYIKGINLKADTLEGYFDKKWSPGYAWFFPLSKDSGNIGLGMTLKHYKKSNYKLRQLLDVFIEQPFIKSRLTSDYKVENIGTWPLNIGPPKWNQLVEDRVILVGDAASLINPFTGGGIETAIISGKLAADVIADKIKTNNFTKASLSEYARKLKKILSKEQTLSLYASKFVGLSPWIVEKLVKIGEKSDLPFIFMKYVYKGIRIKRI